MSREELVEAYMAGQISRRIFIRRLIAAGVSLGAAIVYADINAPRARARPSSPLADNLDLYEECKVTYGGRITTASGDTATFGGNVRPGDPPRGNNEYQDHGPATPVRVRSIDVEAILCIENRATILGSAQVNGSITADYRIDVRDLGEPGTTDTYRIRLSNGFSYDSGERQLTVGNIQIHATH